MRVTTRPLCADRLFPTSCPAGGTCTSHWCSLTVRTSRWRRSTVRASPWRSPTQAQTPSRARTRLQTQVLTTHASASATLVRTTWQGCWPTPAPWPHWPCPRSTVSSVSVPMRWRRNRFAGVRTTGARCYAWWVDPARLARTSRTASASLRPTPISTSRRKFLPGWMGCAASEAPQPPLQRRTLTPRKNCRAVWLTHSRHCKPMPFLRMPSTALARPF